MRPVAHVNRRKQIHELLAQHPDGLTRSEITATLGITSDQFNATKKTMPYVYIDRWQAKKYVYKPFGGTRMMWVAVYCIADIPPDAPAPERSPTEDDLN